MLVLVVAAALVVTRRLGGRPEVVASDELAAASEEETAPLVGRVCEPRRRGPLGPRAQLLAGALLLCAATLCVHLVLPALRPTNATSCMTSDEALLHGSYDVPGIGGLGLPPFGTALWKVHTRSAKAQRLFDQGILMLFGFNHPEAIRNFEAATRADEGCAMCWWGLAYAHGPHVNMACNLAHAMAARAALERAKALAAGLPVREAAYIRALEPRYPTNASQFAGPDGGQHERDGAFASSMAALHAAHPDDLHGAALYSNALLMLWPWDYYERRPTQAYRPAAATMRPDCALARSVIERVLAASPHHPLALHLLIHLTESSAEPAAGEAAARLLADGHGGAANAHLVHMAGHTFLNLGAYAETVAVNSRAVAIDDAYAARCLSPYFPGHQRAQLQAAAMFLAHSALALAYAAPAAAIHPQRQSEWIQALFPAPRPLVRARFGQWAQLLGDDEREDAPHRSSVLSRPFTAALWSYGRALALARTGRRPEAVAERARLSELVGKVPAKTALTGHVFDGCHHRLGLLMEHVVNAALALPDNPRAALASIATAAAQQDGLPYMEPEHWYLQLRLCEGALLLHLNDSAGALRTFDEDLRQHNNSAWALLGRRDALRALGDESGALATEQRLREAMRHADVELRGPCCELGFC